MLKVDLHVHTEYSDGDPLDSVIYYARLHGLNGLAITDHYTIRGAMKVKNQVDDIIVIPGLEIKTSIGHVLLLGVEEIPRTTKYTELYEWALENNALMILVHPIATLSSILYNLDLLSTMKPSAIEVLNSTYPLYSLATRISRLIARRLELPGVAGSDAHRAYQVGMCYTTVDSDSNLDDILEGIRRGRIVTYGRPAPLFLRFKLMIEFLSNRLRLGNEEST
ncbi:MAG: histidinol-phosphatase [Thermoprotei archaeon]|nr:MAG: histidinol-phosphatase [Thermoprotei archaeon]